MQLMEVGLVWYWNNSVSQTTNTNFSKVYPLLKKWGPLKGPGYVWGWGVGVWMGGVGVGGDMKGVHGWSCVHTWHITGMSVSSIAYPMSCLLKSFPLSSNCCLVTFWVATFLPYQSVMICCDFIMQCYWQCYHSWKWQICYFKKHWPSYSFFVFYPSLIKYNKVETDSPLLLFFYLFDKYSTWI